MLDYCSPSAIWHAVATASSRSATTAERVIPAASAQSTPTREEAASSWSPGGASHGRDPCRTCANYYRMRVADTAVAVATLVEEGELVPTSVAGWKRPPFFTRHPLPRRVSAGRCSARSTGRVERDPHRGVFDLVRSRSTSPREADPGYYVLPFLLGDGSSLGST